MTWKNILKEFEGMGSWAGIIEVEGIRYLLSPYSTDYSAYTGSGEDRGYATTPLGIYEPLDKDGAFSGGETLEFTRYSDAEKYAVSGNRDKEYEKAEELFDAKF
tara:strand:- start:2698 stop:3009 length:312 start_codon:yes stop_codon:yes gene_type:complete